MFEWMCFSNCFLDEIEENAKIVIEMMPKNIDDFIPLLSVEKSILEAYKCTLKNSNLIGSDHPIYYFSERLNVRVIFAKLAAH